MADPVVLYPTVESSETLELSGYLEGLVRQQVLPREIAAVFNRLPDLKLQKEAVARFESSQAPWACRIVRELQNPSSRNLLSREKSFAIWRRAFFRTFLRILAVSAGLILIVWVCLPVRQAAPPPHSPAPLPAAAPLNIPAALSHPPAAAPILPHGAKTASKNRRPKAHEAPAARKTDVREVPVPSHVDVQSLSGKAVLLMWKNLGKGYTYTVYSAEDAALREARKEQDHILSNACTIHRQDASPRVFWVAVTARDAHGRESDLSETVRVKW